MLQVNAALWNAIARTGQCRTPIGQLFSLTQEQQNQAHEREANRLEQLGVDPEVALAYLTVAPLLAERKAIADYKRMHSANLSLADVLPEVNTIQDAVILATRQHRLNREQATQLTELLAKLNSFETNDAPSAKPTPSP